MHFITNVPIRTLSVIGKSMLSAIYEESCSNCVSDLECKLCRESLCEACAVQVDGEQCCRPCSASIRNDERLVSYFVEWHQTKNLGDIELTKSPKLLEHQFEEGTTFSVAEFESDQVIGSVTFRSDAQCDVEAIGISSEQSLFAEYRVLVNEREIDEFLTSVYASVRE